MHAISRGECKSSRRSCSCCSLQRRWGAGNVFSNWLRLNSDGDGRCQDPPANGCNGQGVDGAPRCAAPSASSCRRLRNSCAWPAPTAGVVSASSIQEAQGSCCAWAASANRPAAAAVPAAAALPGRLPFCWFTGSVVAAADAGTASLGAALPLVRRAKTPPCGRRSSTSSSAE